MKDTECYVNKAEVKRKIRVWLDYRTSRQVTDGLLSLIEKLPVTVKSQLETTLESDWVSVKDRLPDEDGKYLVCGKLALSDIYGEPIHVVRFTERKEWLTSLSVKYWMPLPQKPESEDDAE